MKIKELLCSALIAGLLAGCAGERQGHHHDQAKLQAEAKVSRADAEKVALAEAPNGTVKEAELEKEHGKLIWSFDITTPGTTDITEVNVDAITGKLVSKEIESAEAEAKENSKKHDQK